MNLILLSIGIIIGVLVRYIKCHISEKVKKYKESFDDCGETQFIESVSFKEKFNKANNITDVLE